MYKAYKRYHTGQRYINRTVLNPYLFGNCESLESVNIPDGVTEICEAFAGCSSLTNITIPDSVTKIYSSISVSEVFEGCTKVQITYKGKTYGYGHREELYSAING